MRSSQHKFKSQKFLYFKHPTTISIQHGKRNIKNNLLILWKREFKSMPHMVMTVSPYPAKNKISKNSRKKLEHQRQQKIGILKWQGVKKGELASLRVISTIQNVKKAEIKEWGVAYYSMFSHHFFLLFITLLQLFFPKQ